MPAVRTQRQKNDVFFIRLGIEPTLRFSKEKEEYIIYSNGKIENLTKINAGKRNYILSSLGIGYEKKLSDRFSLFVNPTVKLNIFMRNKGYIFENQYRYLNYRIAVGLNYFCKK